MMGRMAKVPGVAAADLSSITGIMHTASACPPWVKRAWIDLVGAEKILEGFGATDYVGACLIRGDEWLEHPGSVGRPADCDVRILDEDGNEVPTGEVGEIYMRLRVPEDAEASFEYIGAPDLKRTPDGFATVGDLGWVDADGYVYVADRRVDMIVTGGANVYPAEVEASLSDHRDVADVAVIGLPDEDWGRRVHAVVQPADPANPPAVDALLAHARNTLAAYKCPKTVEFVDELPRNQAGKIRRSDLLAERTGVDA
jgi:bile acid-coenzyme A ligase